MINDTQILRSLIEAANDISEATPKAVKAANAMVAYEAAYDAFLKADNAEKNAKARYLAAKAASSAAYDHYRAAKAALPQTEDDRRRSARAQMRYGNP